MTLVDFTTDFGSTFGSLSITRSGFSGTPKNFEPRRLPNVPPGSKADSSVSALDNLVTTLLLFGEVDAAAETIEPVADASLGVGAPDLLTAEEAHLDTAEGHLLACSLLPLSFELFSSFGLSPRGAFDPSKPILQKK